MNRKGFAPVLLLLIVAVIAASVLAWFYYQGSFTQTGKTSMNAEVSGKPLKVAKYYWPGTFWVEIADSKGFFKEEGLNVELVDTNADYYQSLQDTVDGKIDTNNFPLFDFLSYDLQGANLVAVLGGDVSNGATGIVANSSIKTVADLTGKKVGVAKGTFSEYMLETVLKENNVDISSVEVLNIATEDTVSLLSSGKVDAVASWEPLMSEAVTKLGANIVFNTSELFGLDASVWTFDRKFITERPGDVAAFLRAWKKTIAYIESNEKEAFQIIANNYGATIDDVIGYASSDKILSLEEAKGRFAYSSGIDSTQGLIVGMNEFMISKNLTSETVRTDSILVSSFIKALK